MKKLLSLGILCAAAVVAPLAAHADTVLNGSDNIATLGNSVAGGPGLTTITSFTSTTLLFDNGTPGLPIVGPVLGGPITVYLDTDLGGIVDGTAFTMTIPGYGVFTETAAPEIIGTTTSNFIDIFLLGTFTPSGAFTGNDPSDASVRFSITHSTSGQGDSYGIGGTFATPPENVNPVPEPSSLALLGTGLMTGVSFLRRRKA